MDFFDYIFLATWFVGGFVTGISGMGGAMVAVPVLATFIPPAVLFPVSCLVTLTMCVYMAWVYHRDSIYGLIKKLVIGAIPGSLVGVWLLLYVKAQYIQLLTGTVMLFFVYIQFLRRHAAIVQREETTLKTLLIGFGSGVLITSISFGGPLAAAYGLYLGWSQAQTMGILNVFALFGFTIAAIFQASAGLYTAEVLNLAATGALATVLGAICATPFAKKIPLNIFRLMILTIITCGGVICMWRGLGL